ncbi:hypothetical protein J2752_000500 [Halarchaeum rubridurum]|uniref:RelE toxin-related domain-containing protein n=1 Tax=Halarchaeum rubridurum TaxID=489911 RepID=A0A830FUV8_9EURY|nr:hypothetical protein [Halarchaeum rubridurum]MBP1953619.1 hypothetical protein [Halarchaeum rubridurum]GGM63885.1 hypothetical protein GCM10009017_12450 [Halarchaeum rubridurum]
MAASPNAYRQADAQAIVPHAEQRLRARAHPPYDEDNLRAIWREATPVDYPPAENQTYARYHPGAGVVLLADYGFIRTVIDIQDRPQTTRDYVHNQVTQQ